jgi:CBS domain-containing protein
MHIGLEKPISEVVPSIFKRPLLFVGPSDSLLQAATFLAIGPQIYVDGLVVLEDTKAVGAIGGRHVIEYILYHQDSWRHGTASSVMSQLQTPVRGNDALQVALDVFKKTGFAFVPITIEEKVVTSLSLRDLLKPVAASRLDKTVEGLSSTPISAGSDTSIGSALEIMLEQNVRNLIVKDNDRTTILNDRKILEFLLSHEGASALTSRHSKGLFEIKVGALELLAAKHIKQDTSVSTAAELLTDLNTPCLLVDDSIVTPWDIIMK